MSKKLQINQDIINAIRLGVGDNELDVTNFAVFEARTLSTEPIRRQGGFYNGAVVSPSTLNEMAELINKEGGAIPLLTMHDTDQLPIGRVFRAKVKEDEKGIYALHTQFYISPDEEDLVKKVENSTIDEVSVGFLASHAYCSECDFDYFAEESSIMNIFELTCENEHTIGQDGVHVRLVGLKDWAELSLVGRGAATNAKILSRAKQSMSEDKVNALAASGKPLEARLFTANFKLTDDNQGDLQMDKELMAKLEAKISEVAKHEVAIASLTSDLETSKGRVTELEATNKELETKITELTNGSETAAKLEVANAELTKFKKDIEEVTDVLVPHVKAALTASGAAEDDLKEKSIVELVSMVEEKGLKLHQIIGSEPVSVEDKKDVKLEADEACRKHRLEAFKTKS